MKYENVTTTMDGDQAKKSARSNWTEARTWYGRLPYIYLAIFLCAIYIFSAHQAEKKVREIQQLQSQLTELKWEYTAVSSDWMYSSTRSQIADRVAPMNLRWSSEPPIIIDARKRNKR